jgi:hypothetical protein
LASLKITYCSEELRALEDEKIGASAFDDVEGLEDDEDPNAVWNWALDEAGDYDAEAAASEWSSQPWWLSVFLAVR